MEHCVDKPRVCLSVCVMCVCYVCVCYVCACLCASVGPIHSLGYCLGFYLLGYVEDFVLTNPPPKLTSI